MHSLSYENEFYLHENENHFHIKGWAHSLVLVQRPRGNSGMAYCNDNSQVWKTWLDCVQPLPSLPSLYLFLLLLPYSILEIHSSLNYHSYALVLTKLKPGGGGVILPNKVHMGEDNDPRYNRSLFYVAYLTLKVPVSYTFNWKMIPSLEIECMRIFWTVTMKLTINGFWHNIVIHESFCAAWALK